MESPPDEGDESPSGGEAANAENSSLQFVPEGSDRWGWTCLWSEREDTDDRFVHTRRDRRNDRFGDERATLTRRSGRVADDRFRVLRRGAALCRPGPGR
jgi:hypothetical protein